MRRILLLLPIGLALAACTSAEPPPPPDWTAVFDGSAGEWVDLSHSFSPETIYWPTADGFGFEVVAAGPTEAGYYYASNNLTTSEHGGTHLDAPVHFAEGRETTDEVPLWRLIGPAAVVDVSERAAADYQVTVQDIQDWESRNGPLPEGAILLIRTGWDARWPDPVRYLGTGEKGEVAAADLHFPGLAPEAAEWLVRERNVAAVGIDTASIDYGQSSLFESHRILYERNIPGFENVAALSAMPEAGAFVVALPMKIEGGSGGPLRIVGFVPG
jgi:kynurenine formamidase